MDQELTPVTNETLTPGPPIHILSSLVTIALDGVWSTSGIVAMSSIGGLPALPVIIALTGITCFLSVALTQHFIDHDDWGASTAKGFAMGIIAGVPLPFTGTVTGVILLSWAGVHWLRTRKAKKLPPAR